MVSVFVVAFIILLSVQTAKQAAFWISFVISSVIILLLICGCTLTKTAAAFGGEKFSGACVFGIAQGADGFKGDGSMLLQTSLSKSEGRQRI